MDLSTNPEQESELTRHTRALAPDFRIMGELGRGGMGIVYLALDVNLDREVAIKVLPVHLANQPDVRDRFLREARTAAKLTHPNIVPVYRADEMGGVPFFVMRHVDGESLADRLASQGPVDPRKAARLLHQVAAALDYAHARGVIHRDIKPENILLERGSDSPAVSDFGIARLLEAAPSTATGQVLGTVHYMSPEQVLGERVDGRSDIYSLGVVGYKTVSGQLPFDGKTATAVLVEHVTKGAPRVKSAAPGVPDRLAGVIDRCLSKDPTDRYQTAGELSVALEDAARSIPATIVADVGSIATEPAILSEREAKALWTRAAQLQAETGVQTSLRSAVPSLGPPTVTDRRTLTSGYRLTDVRDAANEVGIPDRYVARAQSELGLVARDAAARSGSAVAPREPAQTSVITQTKSRKNVWVGSSTSIIYEVEVATEVRSEDFELLVNMMQHALGDPGHVSTLGRSLHWASVHQQRRLQISMVPRGGRTVIRADERLSPVVAGIFGGIIGGGGGGVGGGLALPLAIATTHSGVVGLLAFGGTALAAFATARGVFKRVRHGRERELRELVDELAARVADEDSRLGLGRAGVARTPIRLPQS
jgi:eukaryotic-like serine/threonine-protein kinase